MPSCIWRAYPPNSWPTRTGVKDIQNEVLVQLSVNHFLRCLDNRIAYFLFEKTQVHIGACGGKFDESQRSDELTGKPEIADWKILGGALSLRTVKGVSRDLHLAHRVPLSAGIPWFSTGRGHMKSPFRGTVYLP